MNVLNIAAGDDDYYDIFRDNQPSQKMHHMDTAQKDQHCHTDPND